MTLCSTDNDVTTGNALVFQFVVQLSFLGFVIHSSDTVQTLSAAALAVIENRSRNNGRFTDAQNASDFLQNVTL